MSFMHAETYLYFELLWRGPRTNGSIRFKLNGNFITPECTLALALIFIKQVIHVVQFADAVLILVAAIFWLLQYYWLLCITKE